MEKLIFRDKMTAERYDRLLSVKINARNDLELSRVALEYQAGTWNLLRVASKDIQTGDKVMLIRASIHGEEIAGALTILNNFDEIIDYAHQRGVKLIIYPLANPSGFELGSRYNADGDRGEDGNNDYLRYFLSDGTMVGDLGSGIPYDRWQLSGVSELGIRLPLEARKFQEQIGSDPVDQVVAAVDLHQDHITKGLCAAAYTYGYGNLQRFVPIVERVAAVIPLLRNFDIDAGYGSSRPLAEADGKSQSVITDEYGLLIRYDGSFSDYFNRIGVPISIATETTGVTPIETACEVNMIWLTGVMDLISEIN